MYGTSNETVSHIVSECSKPAEQHYKQRYDRKVCILAVFFEKLGFNRASVWYEYEPENVVERKNFKIL